MHGLGVQTLASGVMLFGRWEDDVLDGPVVQATSSEKGSKKVLIFEMGALTGDRRFDPAADWTDIEAPARDR